MIYCPKILCPHQDLPVPRVLIVRSPWRTQSNGVVLAFASAYRLSLTWPFLRRVSRIPMCAFPHELQRPGVYKSMLECVYCLVSDDLVDQREDA